MKPQKYYGISVQRKYTNMAEQKTITMMPDYPEDPIWLAE